MKQIKLKPGVKIIITETQAKHLMQQVITDTKNKRP